MAGAGGSRPGSAVRAPDLHVLALAGQGRALRAGLAPRGLPAARVYPQREPGRVPPEDLPPAPQPALRGALPGDPP